MTTSTRTRTEGARTRVEVALDGGRVRVRTHVTGESGHPVVRPVLVHSDARRARVALVPEGALLLAGDRISVSLVVGSGAALEVVEPGGTVAYDMRGGSARWDVAVEVADGATLVWHGEPFVLSAGADVRRSTQVALGDAARLLLRETLVLGRHGEEAGTLRQHTVVTRAGSPVLVEDLDLDASSGPGLLGGRRALGSVLGVGVPMPEGMVLADGSILDRRIGDHAHEVQSEGRWRHAVRAVSA